MNPDRSDFNQDPEFEDFSDLERSLKKLEPSGLKKDFILELERDLRNVSASKKPETGRVIMARFIPLAAAACVMVAGYSAIKFGIFDNKSSVANVAEVTKTEVPAEDADLVNGLPPRSLADQFVPVSAQEFVLKTSLGGIVEDEKTGEMMREENWEVLESYHFHDPETGTNMSRYIPRKVKVLNPLEIR